MSYPTNKEVFDALNIVDSFLKGMRINGYFGESPQKQTDLDNQQLMIDKKSDIEKFITSKIK